MDPLMPPPARRIAVDRHPTVVAPAGGAAATLGPAALTPPVPPPPASQNGSAVHRAPSAHVAERMRLESLWLGYGERWVVRDVNLPVRQGEVLALIGASGSGKTTLLRSLNRLTEITPGATRAGYVTLDGEEVMGIEVTQLRRRISMVFQQPNPFPMSIFENVAYALREPGARPGLRPGRSSRRRSELSDQVVGALQRAGLYEEVADELDRPALRLSGGQQQRLCIARALAVKPEVLLLDEPCSALDPISTATIEELIVGLRETVAVVIVTHNLQQARRVADHVAFMHLGELVEYGPSNQIFEAPKHQRTHDYVAGVFG
ncbi:MAG TPA: phosphate ABC transporter ATP-binding protein [Solirubrobacteraceae bacterium]|jgi:phosphate transport system ATP-binding protein|nr:phosphate ABC transporter ATP-binding protein [Solirubrobacteraceae bacterium]